MSTVRRCDNCKRIIEADEEYFEFQVVKRKELIGYIGTLTLGKEDFCAECKDKFFKRLGETE